MIHTVRSRLRRLSAMVALTLIVLAVAASAVAAGLMHPPAGKGYAYAGSASKPTCSTTDHAYYGWLWFDNPTASARNRVLVCSSTLGSSAGFGWKNMTLGTASIP